MSSGSILSRGLLEKKYPENVVSVCWKGDPASDFFELSKQYYRCGHAVMEDVARNTEDHLKTDTWFLVGAMLLRQALELAMKSVVCKHSTRHEAEEIINKDKHDLDALFQRKIREYSILLNAEEMAWLSEFVKSSSMLDERSVFYRYPLRISRDTSFEKFAIDVCETANSLIVAYHLIEVCCGVQGVENAPVASVSHDYYSRSNRWLYNCLIEIETTDVKYYGRTKGFLEVAKYLYEHDAIDNADLALPLLFVLRHAIELSLEHLTCKRNWLYASGMMTHDLRKTWKAASPRLRTMAEKNDWDTSVLDNAERLIYELRDIDKNGDTFRYPVDNGLNYRLGSSFEIDVRCTYEILSELADLLSGCNDVIDAEAELMLDIKSEYGS